ncbi:helix-turn-helix transcriptional regulator [Hymenobacter sp. H14-R3]|uniref:helix-turn-helix domain-containing protein n=1 Tax=Hymenobacter sp. H14-R3 TaxID=3046308 RepID=UPI0024B9676C|nr:helix-turn-helix transcriptional regulator [Hymenobacter sp. H14-R3]MDJ0365599.1 helix-turn-helix transcriptional regulator [Hymenobacter sp. H14-R3]
MLFQFGPRSALLLPFVVPGIVATAWLLARAARRGTWPDALLALLIVLPTLTIVQWMLGFAGWYDSHDGYSTAMFYVPWQLNLLLGPAYYFYFRSLTSQEFRLGPRAWWHLGPGLLKVAFFGVALAYDLGWWRGLRGRALPYHFGTKGPVAELLDGLNRPVGYVLYVLLPVYCWWVLVDYRRYTRYLDDNFSDPERLRFAGFRQLLLLQVGSLGLSLLFEVLDQVFDFGYTEAWNYFALRGLFIYGLIAVGIQANYAAASSPLRFDPDAQPDGPSAALVPLETTAGPAQLEAPPAVIRNGIVAAEPAETPAGAAPPTPPGLPSLPPELLAWRNKLLALMAAEQPWLEPELTLTELAQRLRTNPGLLSKVINAGCGQNFNDFVNTYRVQEARRKLADARFAHYSLVGVALESGFNSKSTFNRVFKKLTGQAPGEVVRPKS